MSNDKRFERVYKQSSFATGTVTVFVDKQTGVNYVFCQSGYAGGLTPLLDREGNVVVTPIVK